MSVPTPEMAKRSGAVSATITFRMASISLISSPSSMARRASIRSVSLLIDTRSRFVPGR